MLHVRTHLLLVLSLVICLPWFAWWQTSVIAIMVLLWHLRQGRPALAGLLRGIWRLKWLLVAIMIVYFWLPTQAESRPDWQLAGERALMLMTLFAVVHTLLYRHSAMMVGAALAEGLGKLDRLGLPGTAFSRRLALLMEIALAERERLAAIRPRGRSWFRGLPRLLAEQIRQVEQEAASVEAEDRQFPVLGPSPWWQWLFLLFVWTMLLLVLLY